MSHIFTELRQDISQFNIPETMTKVEILRFLRNEFTLNNVKDSHAFEQLSLAYQIHLVEHCGLCPYYLAEILQVPMSWARPTLIRIRKLAKDQKFITRYSTALTKLTPIQFNIDKATALHKELSKIYIKTSSQEIAIMQAVNLLLKEHLQGFKFVSVVFNVAQPSHAQKQYTYKTNLDLVQDDYVVVKTPEGKFETVRVTEVDTVPSGNYEYKWIVAKLDFTEFDIVQEVEADVKRILETKEREDLQKAKLKEVEANLGKKGVAEVKKVISRTRI